MIFTETKVIGAHIVEVERLMDERGFFARTWCLREFTKQGLDPNQAQFSISFNHKRGTLRGMHIQLPPNAETKLVRCTQGAIYDVVADLRIGSPSYMQWDGWELTAENRKAMYVPKGCAHGFVTLVDNTEVYYQISDFYNLDYAHGFRWNDPLFNIEWPVEVSMISHRDRNYVDFDPVAFDYS